MNHKIIKICTLTILLSACAGVPTKPVAGLNQSLTSDGQLQSRQGDYVVRISKMSSRSTEYKDISKYGLPIRVTVANLSKKPLKFGPENVQLTKNGQPVSALTVESLSKIQQKKDRNDAIWAGVVGTLAIGTSILGALSGDTSLAQTSQQQASESINSAFETYSQSTQYTSSTMDALSHQVTSNVLNTTVLKPKQVIDGLVFFEKVKETDPLVLIIDTNGMQHKVDFQK
ncbi:hypothetical protein QR674_06720 [Acinetobacter chinensis]|jgi:hypothetical protein|uniref:Lipoprotein n=1 Tax=Acinetobacter chinensis TaxID=2004650 RepID=A0ABU3WFQ8_9GAMM|nr:MULTISPECIES: hypothetical protein [Acinetobacter]AXY60547.1 hypothetical protein CDG61_11245 [Acinetobacter sp. WCHAc010052]MDV2468672.1 hypothetical protein [Acinetobacter chinensis]WOE40467.1 hypothetical protein QSG87_11215 [Acinetobacter chinensis]